MERLKQGVVLKKININPEETKQIKLNKDEKSFLQDTLLNAIKQRREDLTRWDIESEGSEDSDWSS